MKHATGESLDKIDVLLDAIRSFEELQEKARGVFYFRSRAFLHFHENAGSVFAMDRHRQQTINDECLRA